MKMAFTKKRSVKSASISKRRKRQMGTRRLRVSSVRKVVRDVVKSEAETKYTSSAQTRQFNSSISSAGECYPLVPQVPQGDGDWQRTGEKISPKYLIVKGKLQYYNSITSQAYVPPSTVRLMILSQKNIKVSSAVQTAADVAHLLKPNAGTGVAYDYTGGSVDNLTPINRDLFTVHMDKKIKLNWMNRQNFTSLGDPTVEWQVGNDRTKYFYCKIKCPKTLTFDDGNGDYPNNFAPFICVGGVNDDGTSAWSANTPYNVAWMSTLYFKDM